VRQVLKFIICLGLSLSMAAGPAFADYRAATAFYARRDYVSAANAYFQAFGYPKAPGEKERSE